MDHSEALGYLYSLGNEVLTAKLGLRNISVLLQYLGEPQKKYPSILIAGTNGKGSVAAFLESVLRKHGYRTGLYTSPHLVRIEERIRVDGTMISAQDFARLTGTVRDAVRLLMGSSDSEAESLQLDRHPTYFEMVTAIAFLYFAEQGVDLATLEVGLGGRLDATNVVEPLVAIITNVDYDHEKYLGSRLEEIATEKAGIIKPRATLLEQPLAVVLGSGNPTVREIVERQCQLSGAQMTCILDDMKFDAKPNATGEFRLKYSSSRWAEIDLKIPLPGEHQVLNVLTSVRALEILAEQGFPIDQKLVKQGIEETHWPGRLEIVDLRPRIVLDGAHNPAAAKCIRDYVHHFLPSRSIVMIFGVMRDKSIAEIAGQLFPLAKKVILTRAETERAAEPMDIARLLPEFDSLYRFTRSPEEALDLARELASDEDTILVVGSLFVIGDLRRHLKSAVVA